MKLQRNLSQRYEIILYKKEIILYLSSFLFFIFFFVVCILLAFLFSCFKLYNILHLKYVLLE